MHGRIAIVGEALGETEIAEGRPFCGAAGKELDRWLLEVGIERVATLLTNVVNLRPAKNDFATLCCGRKELPPDYALPPIVEGTQRMYLRPEYLPEIDRLRAELLAFNPNVAIALGGKAMWALTGRSTISKLRGFAASSTLVPGLTVLPTYHPASVLREYPQRHDAIRDLQKAVRLSRSPVLDRPSRRVCLPDHPAEIALWAAEHVHDRLAFDIETAGGHITCIGFAPHPGEILVVPFTDRRRAGWAYWETLDDEAAAWSEVAKLLGTPHVRKVGQNGGLYDALYLYEAYGIPVANYADDSMLLSHSLQPEASKGLGYLGSIYGPDGMHAWKADHPRGKRTTKREE